MSIITLGDLRALWKTVADWVKGESSDKPKVELASAADISDRAGRKLGQVTFSEPQEVRVTGSTVDRRGPASARPLASSVDVGTTYWSVDTGDVSVSTGSTWRSLGVA